MTPVVGGLSQNCHEPVISSPISFLLLIFALEWNGNDSFRPNLSIFAESKSTDRGLSMCGGLGRANQRRQAFEQ